VLVVCAVLTKFRHIFLRVFLLPRELFSRKLLVFRMPCVLSYSNSSLMNVLLPTVMVFLHCVDILVRFVWRGFNCAIEISDF
jgi:hypothetical protein